MNRRLVHGSLAPWHSNAHIMQDMPGRWEAASVRVSVLCLSWGAGQGYPALEPNLTADPVAGRVFTSEVLSAHLAWLDACEGEPWQRVTVARHAAGRPSGAGPRVHAAPG